MATTIKVNGIDRTVDVDGDTPFLPAPGQTMGRFLMPFPDLLCLYYTEGL